MKLRGYLLLTLAFAATNHCFGMEKEFDMESSSEENPTITQMQEEEFGRRSPSPIQQLKSNFEPSLSKEESSEESSEEKLSPEEVEKQAFLADFKELKPTVQRSLSKAIKEQQKTAASFSRTCLRNVNMTAVVRALSFDHSLMHQALAEDYGQTEEGKPSAAHTFLRIYNIPCGYSGDPRTTEAAKHKTSLKKRHNFLLTECLKQIDPEYFGTVQQLLKITQQAEEQCGVQTEGKQWQETKAIGIAYLTFGLLKKRMEQVKPHLDKLSEWLPGPESKKTRTSVYIIGGQGQGEDLDFESILLDRMIRNRMAQDRQGADHEECCIQ